MESPVVVDKPPEYHGNNDRGFPFEDEEGSGAWSELAARHPDIAARLRQRPASATWARKRRPSSQDATDDFGESFRGFDRFPFEDIPPEFREHFPSHWNRRFGSRDEPQPETQPSPPTTPHQQTAATQTEHTEPTEPEQTQIPQYGLRNTVDLGQKSAADPSLVDADDRNQRCMSAPPNARTAHPDMSAHNQERAQSPPDHHSNVRHIPIFVEGRDEPVINKSTENAHYTEPKPAYQPPPQPHIDRDQYFADDGPASFHHPPNFTRAFGTPFNKGFRQGPQPFVQQKVYPQNAFARGASPQRSQSPKPHPEPEQVKVPVHHEHAAPKTEPPRPQQPKPQPQPKQPPPPRQPSPQSQREQTPPKPQPPCSNDPITVILSIQTDVLNLMTEVENFTGTKKDKRYLFLDEMLTRNLIKLDNIETEGKENIRLARKEAIRCIQKCIAVLEAKAENKGAGAPQTKDMEVAESAPENQEPVAENGEVEMKEAPTVDETKNKVEPQSERIEETHPTQEQKNEQPKPQEETPKPQEEQKSEEQKIEAVESTGTQPPAADTRTEETKPDEQQDAPKVEDKPSPKKKIVKKRDKSKDKKEPTKDSQEVAKDSNADASKDSNKQEREVENMQVDDKGDRHEPLVMDVDGAASQ